MIAEQVISIPLWREFGDGERILIHRLTSVTREKVVDGFIAGNKVFWCPHCKRTWARLTFGAAVTVEPAWADNHSCEDCWKPQEILDPVPGSILHNGMFTSRLDTELLKVLPEDILRHEFNLHLRIFDND